MHADSFITDSISLQTDLLPLCSPHLYHKVIEGPGFEKDHKDHLVSTPLPWAGEGTSAQLWAEQIPTSPEQGQHHSLGPRALRCALERGMHQAGP